MAPIAGLGMARPLQRTGRMWKVAVVAVLLAASQSHADEAVRARVDKPVALAVNAPLMWASAISGSAYVRFAPNNALRLNVAAYDHHPSLGYELLLATRGASTESSYSGGTVDVGVGWQYFPRRVWDGFVVELGVLRRGENHVIDEASWNSRIRHREATGYAARAMVGWSWLLGEHVFVAASIGLSLGRYSGTESVQPTDDLDNPSGMPMTSSIGEDRIEGEAYLRIGVPFGN